MDDNVKKLEARITELETKLEAAGARAEPADISAEELRAFQKVRDVLEGDLGGGINECRPITVTIAGPITPTILRCFRCFRCYRCYPCINECICGPCIMGGGGAGGQFGGFGD